MFLNKMPNFPKKVSFIILIFLFLHSCNGFMKRSDVKDNPINDKDKRAKNIKEGRGITLGNKKSGTGKFDFATSNEMWRATIQILDFVPLATADYGGGLIITDWYSEDLNSDESIKIMVNFLSNEIRADGLKVKIYKKICNNTKCNTQLMSSKLENEIKLAVLKKAAQIKTQDRRKKAEETEFISEPKSE